MRLSLLLFALALSSPMGMMSQEVTGDSVGSLRLREYTADSLAYKDLPMSRRFDFDRHIDTAMTHGGNYEIALPRMTYHENPSLFRFSADGAHEESLNLIDRNYARYGFTYSSGRFNSSLYGVANKYQMDHYVHNQFGIAASFTYSFSERLSATIFGQYYSSNPYISMAAMPYISSSQYGGFVTISGEKAGISLGVRRYYDPFRGGWVTAPIVTPKLRFSSKFELEIPVGDLVKDIIDSWARSRDRYRGGTIMPAMPKMYLPAGPPPPVR